MSQHPTQHRLDLIDLDDDEIASPTQPWSAVQTPQLQRGGISMLTVVAMVRVVPYALSLPGLSTLNQSLAREVRERTQTENKFRTFFDAAPTAMIAIDREGTILMGNRMAERLLAYEEGTLVGRRVDELVPERYRPKHPDHRKEFFRDPRQRPMGTGRDLFALRRDGAEIPVEIGLTPLPGDDGPVVLSSILDISERLTARRLLEEKADALARSNADLEKFAYVASHDLQEPLRMVTSYLQLIKRRYADTLDDDGREFIHYAVDGAQRMQNLILDLLEFSRVTSAGAELTPTSATAALDRALETLRTTIEETGAEIVRSPLPEVVGDPGQLERLFQNLIGNALKYRSDAAPVIRITATPEDEAVRVDIEDNGIGIEEKSLERIFEVLERLHSREEYEGTGIGLAICRRIVQRHGGTIHATSGPGAGATFTFTLPRP